jgi:hypothetical protein
LCCEEAGKAKDYLRLQWPLRSTRLLLQGRVHLGSQLRSRTQNNVAPATAAGIISTFTPGIISAR